MPAESYVASGSIQSTSFCASQKGHTFEPPFIACKLGEIVELISFNCHPELLI